MKRLAVLSAGVLALAACTATDSTAPAPSFAKGDNGNVAWVTSSADAGAGSFRAAVLAANATPEISRIVFERGIGSVALATSVAYTGPQSLTIDGNGAVLDGNGLAGTQSAFRATTAANLDLRDLTVQNAPGSGIEVQVPGDATGILRYELTGIRALGNAGFGVVINDQVDPTSAEPPVRPNSAGSPAGLVVRVKQSRFEGNGFGAGDRDGLRVNEGGEGSLDFSMSHSQVLGNGGDGVEVDERGPGDAIVDLQHTELLRNGEFDPEDLDDGLDVDELDGGHLIARLVHVKANDNFEEGIDLNENDAGDMRIGMNQVEASGNTEEGVDLEEDDDYQGGGDLVASLSNVTANGNTFLDGDAGIKIRERGDGDVDVTLQNARTEDNTEGGISVREDAGGNLSVRLVNPLATGNGDHGIIYDENGAGDLAGFLVSATSSNNGGAGVRAEQQAPGAGTLTVQGLTAAGNGGGATSVSGVTLAP